VEFYLQKYKKEFTGVSDRRLWWRAVIPACRFAAEPVVLVLCV
jgi:hypothetical protein